MTPTTIDFGQERLAALARYAAVLEHVENGRLKLGAPQYRAVVRLLTNTLRRDDLDPGVLRQVLDAHPAAATVYENLHYGVAGLARSPLDQAVQAERLAAEAIGRARGHR